jgi:hypothetical protein
MELQNISKMLKKEKQDLIKDLLPLQHLVREHIDYKVILAIVIKIIQK